MTIQKIVVKNYKLLKDIVIGLNSSINIFVGDNDAGKSSILEVLTILTTGKLNGFAFDRQLKANLFNQEVRKHFIADVETGNKPIPPQIVMEAFFDGDSNYKGSDNEFGEDAVGIRVTVDLSESNTETYKRMLEDGDVKDIPVELYGVSYYYFSGASVSFRYSPFRSVFIDTARKGYGGMVDHLVSDSIANNLTEEDLVNLAIAYKASRSDFQDHDVVKKLNETIKASPIINGREVSINLREDEA